MRAIIVCNPRAGQGAVTDLSAATRILGDAGWQVEVCHTAGPEDASNLARRAADAGMDAVLAAGGDGTVNEVVQGLANSRTALGYLPLGTVNIWARELHLPLDIEGAARAFVRGRRVPVDLGLANGRYFLLMTGLGFDAAVVRRARMLERHKHRLGVLPYVASGLLTAPAYRGTDMELRYDGIIRRVQALMIVAGNTRLYGGYFQFTPQAVANDGWLDLCIVKGRGTLALARQSLPLLISRSIGFSDVEMLRVREVSVTANPALAYQVDGELAGTTPLQLAVAPRAVQAIIPEHFASTLFA